MATLIEDIIILEKEADEVIERAHQEARKISEDAEKEFLEYQENLARELENRLAAFEKEVMEKHAESIVEVEKRLSMLLGEIEALPEERLLRQVQSILLRFRNW